MANQTLAITPADTADPTLLYRALSRITEELDQVKGYRGAGVDSQQAELDNLVQVAQTLKERLETLLAELDVKLNQETPKNLADLAADVADLQAKVELINATKPILGFAVTLTGAGSSNPSLTNAYNVASVTRLSTGYYRIVLTAAVIAGKNVLASSTKHVRTDTTGNVFVKTSLAVVNPTTLDFYVHSLSNTFTAVTYDLTVSDKVDLTAILSP